MKFKTMKDLYLSGKRMVLVTRDVRTELLNANGARNFGRIVNTRYSTMSDLEAYACDSKGYIVFSLSHGGIMEGVHKADSYFIVKSDHAKILKSYMNKVNPKGIMDTHVFITNMYYDLRESSKKLETDILPNYSNAVILETKAKFEKLITDNQFCSTKGKLMFKDTDLEYEFNNLAIIEYNVLGCSIKELMTIIRIFKVCTDLHKHVKAELNKYVMIGTHLRLIKTLEMLLMFAADPKLVEDFDSELL